MEIKVTVEANELAVAINNLATALSGKVVKPAFSTSAVHMPAPEPAKAPESAAAVPVAAPPQYTTEQIMQAGASLMDAGKIAELTGLLGKFGVQAVMDLKEDQLGAFATEMRKLGAAI